MASGLCARHHEERRHARRHKDFFVSLNDALDERTPLERLSMDTTRVATMAPPPGAHPGWTGRYRACRGCGTITKPELEGGYCEDCFGDEFGPLGLKMAQARRKSADPGRDDEAVAAPDAATVALPPAPATPAAWHHDEYPACLNCESTERPHQGRGLCSACRPLSLRPGYDGYIAPKKGPGGRALPEREAGGRLPWWYTAARAPEPGEAGGGCAPEPPADGAGAVDARPSADPDPAPEPMTHVPAVAASAVVAEAADRPVARADLGDIPLADLLAEVGRRAADLAARVGAAESRATEAAADAAKYRRIRAMMDD